MTSSHGVRPAVVLSGGGANGAYEAGVLLALLGGKSPATGYVPLNPAVLTGTSIGAYNAAVLAARLTTDGPQEAAGYLEDVWANVIPRDDLTRNNHMYRFRGNPLDLFDFQDIAANPFGPVARLAEDFSFFSQDWLKRGIRFLRSSGGLVQRSLEFVDLSTLITREPFERLLRKTIDPENIRRSERVLVVAATDWYRGKVRLFVNDTLNGLDMMAGETVHQAVLASSSLPGVFQPVYIKGEPYVDGALLMNTPLKPAIANGQADVLHVIYLDPDVKNIPVDRLQNTIDTIDRMSTIMFATQMNSDVEVARRINRGLELVKRVGLGERLTRADVKPFLEAASYLEEGLGREFPYRQIAIHRYRPREDLSGPLGFLDFGRDRMVALIQRGFQDAVEHDCRDCITLSGIEVADATKERVPAAPPDAAAGGRRDPTTPRQDGRTSSDGGSVHREMSSSPGDKR